MSINSDITRYIIGLAISVLLSVVAYYSAKSFDKLDMLSSQLTGHLITHGRTDLELEIVMKKVDNMRYNQYILCKYGENTWPNHEKCKINLQE